MTKLVECTFRIPVDFPEDTSDGHIEDGMCFGTGVIGQVFEDIIRQAWKGNYCWACNVQVGGVRVVAVT